MHVNNETGVIQDIQAIGELCAKSNSLFHVDAAQSAGKVPIDVARWPVDLISFSAHKCYGPKGVGALYVRKSSAKPIALLPLLHGGGQEQGLRPGTLPVHQIVGMGEAWRLASEGMASEVARIQQLRDKLWHGIQTIPGITLNGDWRSRIAHNLNVSFAGVDGSALPIALKDIAISSGAACASGIASPSHVLRAMGVPHALSQSALRITLGRFTTEDEIDFAIEHIQAGLKWLHSLNKPKSRAQ
jgi:cysteine desulfurase